MQSFRAALNEAEIADVATFVHAEFVSRRAVNTYYHTAENGWPKHRRRYGAAFPFVLGEVAVDAPDESLDEERRAGRRLFLDACITCHEPKSVAPPGAVWDKFPLSEQGCGVVCHGDGRVSFPWRRPGERTDASSAPTPYAVHGVPPHLANLDSVEREGERLYQQNCAFCHAMDGTGGNWIGSFLDPHPRNLTDPTATTHLDGDRLLATIRDGLPGTSMPAWKTVLAEEQIAAVAAYVQRAFLRRPAALPR